MLPRRLGLLGTAFSLAACLVIFWGPFEAASSNSDCTKAAIFDIVMKKCKFGLRYKRGLEKFYLDKVDYKEGNARKFDIPELLDAEVRKVQQKRQLSPESIATVAVPVLSEANPSKKHYDGSRRADFDDIQRRVASEPIDIPGSIRELYEEGQPPSLMGQYVAHSENYPLGAFQTSRPFSALKVSATEDILGFDLSAEEKDEFYNQLSDRLPRGSKPQKGDWDMFVKECCQNFTLCKQDLIKIPC